MIYIAKSQQLAVSSEQLATILGQLSATRYQLLAKATERSDLA